MRTPRIHSWEYVREDKLRAIIYEAVEQELVNEGMMSGLKDYVNGKFKQTKSSISTITGGQGGLGDRLSNAKKNWVRQAEINDFNDFVKKVKEFVQANNIDPKTTTIAQLIGFGGRASSKKGNRASQIAKTGGKFYR